MGDLRYIFNNNFIEKTSPLIKSEIHSSYNVGVWHHYVTNTKHITIKKD